MGFDETRKQPRLSKEYVYEKLRDSLIINSKEEIETKGLEQLIRTTDKPNDAIELVKKLDKLVVRIIFWCWHTSKEKYFRNLKATINLLAL